ncbi:MAG: hypothetical protein AAGA83_27030 [Cyanobacteria bacterium P01_F01_bin.116]
MSAAFSLAPKLLETVSTAYDLKVRLDWDESALTAIDVTNRDLFSASHISGAIFMPADELVSRAAAS